MTNSTLPFGDFLNNLYSIIEQILPYLIPFMRFILPFVVLIGNFLRNVIEKYLFPYIPLYPDTQNYTFWIILTSIIGVAALIMIFLQPDRTNVKEEI